MSTRDDGAPRFLAVAGGTGAGKSTLVRELVERFDGCVVELDAYYLDRTGVPDAVRQRINYDEPAAIDDQLLVAHLDRLALGRPIDKPVYSFATHTRVGEVRLAPTRLVIVEGLFTWWWDAVRERMGLRIFVDAPADIRFTRRLQRDIAERGRTPEQVVAQYLATVRPMHERYVEPCRASADLVVDNGGSLGETLSYVVALMDAERDRSRTHAGASGRH